MPSVWLWHDWDSGKLIHVSIVNPTNYTRREYRVVELKVPTESAPLQEWFCTVIYPPEAVKHARQIYDVDKKQMVLVDPNQPPVWKGETHA